MNATCDVHPDASETGAVVVEVLGGDGQPFRACAACWRRMTEGGAIVPPIGPVAAAQPAPRMMASPARLAEAARMFAPGKP